MTPFAISGVSQLTLIADEFITSATTNQFIILLKKMKHYKLFAFGYERNFSNFFFIKGKFFYLVIKIGLILFLNIKPNLLLYLPYYAEACNDFAAPISAP